jgi:hypothetical protein
MNGSPGGRNRRGSSTTLTAVLSWNGICLTSFGLLRCRLTTKSRTSDGPKVCHETLCPTALAASHPLAVPLSGIGPRRPGATPMDLPIPSGERPGSPALDHQAGSEGGGGRVGEAGSRSVQGIDNWLLLVCRAFWLQAWGLGDMEPALRHLEHLEAQSSEVRGHDPGPTVAALPQPPLA